MFRFGRMHWICLLAALLAGPSVLARAQAPAIAPPASVAAKLGSLANRAAMAFVGQVIAIERQGGVVAVSFRVDQTVLGVAGASYTLREWAGLWPQGQVRYTVGERALVFLRGNSDAGLSSPVDGAEGVVPVVVQGADSSPLLDVRRLAAAVLRPVGAPLPDETDGAILLNDAVTLIRGVAANGGAGISGVVEPGRRPLPGSGLRLHGPAEVVPVLAGRSPLPVISRNEARVTAGGFHAAQ